MKKKIQIKVKEIVQKGWYCKYTIRTYSVKHQLIDGFFSNKVSAHKDLQTRFKLDYQTISCATVMTIWVAGQKHFHIKCKISWSRL